jgi:cytochrome c553
MAALLMKAAGPAFKALALGACAGLAGGQALAGDIEAGQAKARPGAVCHGALGMSVAPDAPKLAGQPAQSISSQLPAYRSEARQHQVMSLMATPPR